MKNWKVNKFEETFSEYKSTNFLPDRIYYVIIYKCIRGNPIEAIFYFYNLEEYRKCIRDFKSSNFNKKDYWYYTRIL